MSQTEEQLLNTNRETTTEIEIESLEVPIVYVAVISLSAHLLHI